MVGWLGRNGKGGAGSSTEAYACMYVYTLCVRLYNGMYVDVYACVYIHVYMWSLKPIRNKDYTHPNSTEEKMTHVSCLDQYPSTPLYGAILPLRFLSKKKKMHRGSPTPAQELPVKALVESPLFLALRGPPRCIDPCSRFGSAAYADGHPQPSH